MQILYFNQKLEIKNSPSYQTKNIRLLWEELWEDYNEWLSKAGTSNLGFGCSFAELLVWKRMSTWWFNNLCSKDTEHNNEWIKRLRIAILGACNEFLLIEIAEFSMYC